MKDQKYMSKEYTNCLRGIFAILVVVHHLYQYSGLFRGTYFGVILQLLGVLSVAMFFFFSGYGLMLSDSKTDYIKHFFSKRFLPLYCFYVFLIILYSIWTLLLEKSVSPMLVLQSFLFGRTIVTNGWYLQTTFVAYLLYLLVFKYCKIPKIKTLFFGVEICIYCVICILFGLGITWYQTIPCMVLGMVYCLKKICIDKLLKKHAWLVFILFGIAFAVSFLLSAFSGIKVIFNVLYSLFFVCAMVALSYILCNTSLIENNFTKLCGKYSLFIYVSHGLFLRLIKLEYIKNTYVYIFVVLVGTIFSSVILKIVYTKIVLLFQRIHPSK